MSETEPEPASAVRVGLLLGLLFGFSALGSSAISVVLPEATTALGLDTAGAAWVFTAFTVPFAVSTAVFGRLADVDGTRRPLVAGVALCAAGALTTALAPSFAVLLSGRVVQGLGAGALPVLVPTVAAARFDGVARADVLGRITAMMTMFAATGPLLGGLADAAAGWRAAFALPSLSLLLLLPVARLGTRQARRGRLDLVGAALTCTAATALVLTVQARTAGATLLAASLAVLAVALPLLVAHVRRRPEGFVPMVVVRSATVRWASLAGMTLPAAWFASLLVVPLLLTREHGWSPLQVGVLLLPGAALGPVGSRLASPLARRFGSGRTAALGVGMNALGTAVSAATVLTPLAAVVGIALVTGGFGLAQPTLVAAVSGALDSAVRGAALGLFTLVFFLGGGLGPAMIGSLGDPLGLPTALLVVAGVPAIGALAGLQVGRAARPRPATV